MQPPSQGQSSGSWNDPDALQIAFKEYQLLMEGTDKISDRRQTVNTEFVSINAIFLTGVGYLLLQLFLNATHVVWFVIGFFLIALIMNIINNIWLKLSTNYSRLLNLRFRYLKELETHMHEGGIFPKVDVPLISAEANTLGKNLDNTRGTYSLEDVYYGIPAATKGAFGFTVAEQHVAHTFIFAYWGALVLSFIPTGLVLANYFYGFKIPGPFF